MKQTALILLMAASIAATAQTAPKPAAPAAKPHSAASAATGIKLPPGVPPARGLVKTAFALRYQDIKIGTGAEAEPNKLYKVHYTGWRAADGVKFDSSYDHPRQPVLDKDGKPAMDADGKPKLGDLQPFAFPQGFGRLIPGWDQGFYGMKIGGKRRLFIPWQLAYGARGRPSQDPKYPGIPPKADLIFDVELVDITELQMSMPSGHPGISMGGHPTPGGTMSPHGTAPIAAPAQPTAPAQPATPPAPVTPPAPASPAQPATPPHAN